jgi:hypothetical protein
VAATGTTPTSEGALRARVAELEATLKKQTAELTRVTTERDALRKAYAKVLEQLELLRHRITVAKAERIGNIAQLELEFAAKTAELAALVKKLDEVPPVDVLSDQATGGNDAPSGEPRKTGGGRRNLQDLTSLEEKRIELIDPVLELTMERVGWEETFQLGYRPGAPVRVVTARGVYKEKGTSEPKFTTVPVPPQLLARCLMAPSMLAHIVMNKVGYGLTFFRMEQRFLHEGLTLDRGSMSRYFEDVGASLGAAIVEAMRKDALANAFCLATDATGVAIQPARVQDSTERRPCDKGHFFVVIADRDHVFFEYQPKHTSEAVCTMFRGFSGYILSDAHTIYDALHRGEAAEGKPAPLEVACWSHCRRYFWEAAMMKHALGREGLLRLRVIFEHEAKWAKHPPEKRRAMRRAILRPLIDDFYAWVHAESTNHPERGPIRSALGYAMNQEQALRRFLDDGRLPMTNNGSERALRTIAIGRKNWLFFGSGDHASAAANLFSLVSSCKLHGLDPERYLRDVIRVVPHWPRDRYLELAPKYWAATRARLVAEQLDAELGDLTVPDAARE